MAELTFFLDGKQVAQPDNINSLKIIGNYTGGSVQPQIAMDDLEWVRDAKQFIDDWVDAGKIFVAIPLKIVASDGTDSHTWDGYVDLRKYARKEAVTITGMKSDKWLEETNKKLEAITYGYLSDLGKLKQFKRVWRIVEPTQTSVEQMSLALAIYILGKEIMDARKRLVDAVREKAEVAISPLDAAAEGSEAIGKTIGNAVYLVLLVVNMIALVRELVRIIREGVRRLKGMTYRYMLETAFSHIGLEFESNIAELEWAFLPSRSYDEEKIDGIPKASDYGYRASELLNLCMEMFNAQLHVDGNKAYLYTEGDPFWTTRGGYSLPNVLIREMEYNTSDAVFSRIFSFATDVSDEWTIEQFKGVNVEVQLRNKQTTTIQTNLLTGYKEVRFQTALGKRVGAKNLIVNDIHKIAKALQKIIRLFGGNFPVDKLNFTNMLVTSNRYFSVAKTVALNGEMMAFVQPAAKDLYEKYWKYRSLAEPTGQRKKAQVRVPFTLDDFGRLSVNGWGRTADGKPMRATAIEWYPALNQADLDIEIVEQYTTELTEKLIEG